MAESQVPAHTEPRGVVTVVRGVETGVLSVIAPILGAPKKRRVAPRHLAWLWIICVTIAVATLAVWAVFAGYFRPRVPFYSLSWELSDAPQAKTANERVYLWLRANRRALEYQARKRAVDVRAIEGVIAYEALLDVVPPQLSSFTRYVGPGKVHYRVSQFYEGDPLSKEVEERGYLPRRTMAQRMQILRTDDGSITYIAAIMAAMRDVAKAHGLAISHDPGLLATFYSAWSLTDEDQFLRQHHSRLQPNAVGVWVVESLNVLASAVRESKGVVTLGSR